MHAPLLRSLLLFATLTAASLPALAGTPDAPEIVDAPDDAKLAPLDLAAVWFEANATDLSIHLERGSSSGTPPPAVVCQQGNCAGAGISLRVVYAVLKPDGSPAPAFKDYAFSYVLVRLGPDDPAFQAAAGWYDSAATGTLVGPVPVKVDGANVTVSVPLGDDTLAIPNDAAAAAGYKVAPPYALSYVMACAPSEGCVSQGSPRDETASLWDRAPDSGSGADFTFPTPAAGPADVQPITNDTPASATTVTVVQTRTETQVYTETQSFVETVTATFAPDNVNVKAAPGAGILVLVGIMGLAAIRRRLA